MLNPELPARSGGRVGRRAIRRGAYWGARPRGLCRLPTGRRIFAHRRTIVCPRADGRLPMLRFAAAIASPETRWLPRFAAADLPMRPRQADVFLWNRNPGTALGGTAKRLWRLPLAAVIRSLAICQRLSPFLPTIHLHCSDRSYCPFWLHHGRRHPIGQTVTPSGRR